MSVYGFFDDKLRQSFLDSISRYKLDTSLGERHDELTVTIKGDIDFDTELEIDAVYNTVLSAMVLTFGLMTRTPPVLRPTLRVCGWS